MKRSSTISARNAEQVRRFGKIAEQVRRFGKIAGLYRYQYTKQPQEPWFAWKEYYSSNIPGISPDVYRLIRLKSMRKTMILQCIQATTKAFEDNELSQEDLEAVLDYFYAELSSRMKDKS